MKKVLLVLLLSVVSLSLVACGGENKSKIDPEVSKDVEQEEVANSDAKEIYSINDTWEVPGQWTLKIDSVTATADRNSFTDKDPVSVVIVKYSYENLGYESDSQDLFMTPSGAIGDDRKMGFTYPANLENFAKQTPVGAICEGAEEAFGFGNDSKTVKIMFEKFDNDGNKQKATFEIDVTE